MKGHSFMTDDRFNLMVPILFYLLKGWGEEEICGIVKFT